MKKASKIGEKAMHIPTVIIDEALRVFLTPLDPEAYARLEIDILEHGIIYPLLLWNGILIDGYNRFNIASKHNIPFKVEHLEFDSREAVKIWMITNQVSRRNLSPMQLSYFRGKHYNLEKLIIGNPNLASGQYTQCYQTDNIVPQGRTATRLATHYNVSQITILRDSQLAYTIDAIGEISAEAKRQILSGEASISRSRLQELHSATQQELLQTIEMILDGTHPARMSRQGTPEDADANEADTAEIRNVISHISTRMVNVRRMVNRAGTNRGKNLKPALRGLINMLEELYSRV